MYHIYIMRMRIDGESFYKIGISKDPVRRAKKLVKNRHHVMSCLILAVSIEILEYEDAYELEHKIIRRCDAKADLLYDYGSTVEGFTEYVLSLRRLKCIYLNERDFKFFPNGHTVYNHSPSDFPSLRFEGFEYVNFCGQKVRSDGELYVLDDLGIHRDKVTKYFHSKRFDKLCGQARSHGVELKVYRKRGRYGFSIAEARVVLDVIFVVGSADQRYEAMSQLIENQPDADFLERLLPTTKSADCKRIKCRLQTYKVPIVNV